MRIAYAVTATLLAISTVPATSEAQSRAALATKKATSAIASKTTVVLVHGAFADGSSWSELIPLLQQDGYNVVAVQIPMESLAGDVAATKRVLDAQSSPVVVVGHSYGGAVITGAAAGNAKVKALVYINAFAPEPGESVDAYLKKYPSSLDGAVKPDAAGFVYIDPAKYHDVFAGDLPMRQTNAMAVAQKPIFGGIFGQSVGAAAWKNIPSWYIVSQQDHALNPDLERLYAKRIGAKTIEIKASHLVFISHPQEVAKLISQAVVGGRK